VELTEFCRQMNIPLRQGEPLSAHTSFKIGGPADVFCEVASVEQVCRLITWFYENKQPYYILGRGSNLLVPDEGLRAPVIWIGEALGRVEQIDECRIRAQAGAPLSALCRAALQAECSGLEFAWGIPGSVGGAVFMNAGAYGGQMQDVLESCDYINEKGELCRLTAEELQLGYRHSVFHKHPEWVIVEATVRLQKDEASAIRARMEDYAQRRCSKQPLELPSAGSVFKRPEGHFAGGLIEQCGLKGLRIGGAEVSKKHAGFIVNVGGATCRDVCALIEEIRRIVLEQTGVALEPEIRCLEQR